MRLGRRCTTICVASTWITSVAPTPKAMRAHAAMGAGVAVAAHQQGAGQGEAQLGPHDMDDALAGLAEIEQLDAPALASSRM